VSAAAATANPSLLAAVTVMLLLPHPKRLMVGYLLGAYTTSIVVGLAFVFSLHGSGLATTSRHTLSPGADVVIGIILATLAVALATDRDAPLRNWRARRKARKPKQAGERSWQQRTLEKGSARMTFIVGAAVSFPGITYLNALHHIVELDPGGVAAVLLVVFFCVMQQLLLELPLLGYVLSPERTAATVARLRAWLHRRGRLIVVVIVAALGLVLTIRGAAALA